jgi:hypothetical protein
LPCLADLLRAAADEIARLATRNLKDFQETGINVLDPWQHAG